MGNWWDISDWSSSDIQTFVAIMVPVLGALAAGWRFWWRDPDRRAALVFGRRERRYARWFAGAWDKYESRYLEGPSSELKRLSLRETYVRLSIAQAGTEAGEPVDAFRELSKTRPSGAHVFVLGQPGSGKSTLLKAYAMTQMGVASRAWGQAGHQVAFLVPLQRFAAQLNPNETAFRMADDRLLDYLLGEILHHNGVASGEDAKAFLRRALRQRRVEVLLDGLDEVPALHQASLRAAVAAFARSAVEEMPTIRARLLITCRTENFHKLENEWRAAIDSEVYELAVLRDAEMNEYVEKLRGAFRDPKDGPARYLQEVRRSKTFELHRVPLVLAMSVGIYAKKDKYEIPSDIGSLYQRMITHLLERHKTSDRNVSSGTSVLKFLQTSFKVDFLSAFATRNAQALPGSGEPFGEFSEQALIDLAEQMAPDLDIDPAQAVDYVDEIIIHSGLLDQTKSRHYVFAHRSLQEYLVATHLRRDPSGPDYLLGRARAADTWRNVIRLYAATTQQNQTVDDFLKALMGVDLALAGGCLAWGVAAVDLAAKILRALPEDINAHIARADAADETYRRLTRFAKEPSTAMVAAEGSVVVEEAAQQAEAAKRAAETARADADAARSRVAEDVAALFTATQSLRTPVRDLANTMAEQALAAIIDRPDLSRILGAETGGLVRVVDALADTDADHVIALVPKIAAEVVTDARLVPPLWRCLQVPGLLPTSLDAETPLPDGVRKIVAQLLTLATTPDCLEELAVQPTGKPPPFATPAMRAKVYPFPRHGHRADSNLVTLLCWADKAQVEPEPSNAFFEARQRDPRGFKGIEEVWSQDQRSLPFLLARIASGAGLLAVFAVSAYLLGTQWETVFRARGWPLLGWAALPAIVAPLLFIPMVLWAGRQPDDSFAGKYLRAGAPPGRRTSGNAVAEACAAAGNPGGQLLFVASPLAYAVALAPLAAASVPGYLALATVAAVALVWAPFLAVFDKGDLSRRRNRLLDMYHDDRSVHWLVRDAQQPLRPSSS